MHGDSRKAGPPGSLTPVPCNHSINSIHKLLNLYAENNLFFVLPSVLVEVGCIPEPHSSED